MRDKVSISVDGQEEKKAIKSIEFAQYGQAVLRFDDASKLKVPSKTAGRLLGEREFPRGWFDD